MAEDTPPGAHSVPRKASKKFSINLPTKNDVSTASDPMILSSSPTLEKKRRRGDRSPVLRSSPSPTMRRNRQKGTSSASPTSHDDCEELVDSDQELEIDMLPNSASDLLMLPQEVLMRILDSMAPAELSRSSSTCRYLRSLSLASWRSLAKLKHPQYSPRDWKILTKRFKHSQPLLTSALLHATPSNSNALPPSQHWPFLYFHAGIVRSRNWLAPRDPVWTSNFTAQKPVRGTAQGVNTALHQYHLFPTCMAADDNFLICGSGCYESVGDPTTLMIGARLLQFFDVNTGEMVRSIPAHPSAILDLQIDDQYVYTASIDRSIGVWDKTTGEHVSSLYGHLKAIYQIQLYENLLISAGKDRTIRFWDPKVRDQQYEPLVPQQIPDDPIPLAFGFHKDGTVLKQTPDTNLRAGSKALKSVILAHSHSVRRFCASNGNIFSVSSQGQGCVWDIETNTLIRSLDIMDDAITATLLNNDAVAVSTDATQHFDLRSPRRSPVRENKEMGGRHITLDTCKLLLSDTKGFIRVWDWNLFKEVNSLRVAKHRCCYFYDPGTERLFTGGSDKVVKLYDFNTRPSLADSLPSDKKCLLM